LLFLSDPDACCRLNKVLPLEPVLAAHDIWINGVRAEQSAHRSRLDRECAGPRGVLRYHPLLSWTQEDVQAYRRRYELPAHPLDPTGRASIGCAPCTHLEQAGNGRNGRWLGLNRKECGLHTHMAGTAS
jgi:phosphoadenosine phosphosulfate reductase